MPGSYLLALAVSLAGLVAIDSRWKLALFANAARTLATLGTALGLYLIWDLLGINLGIFFEGKNSLLIGVNLLPQLPVEEPVFLLLLCYTILIIWQGFTRLRPKSGLGGSK